MRANGSVDSTTPPTIHPQTKLRASSDSHGNTSASAFLINSGISQEVWDQEREKAAQRMAEASSEIQQVLRESMGKLVQHMAERLRDGTDGKPLRFKESTVSNLVEFLENFEFRNVTDDHELQQIVKQARALLQGVGADDLRNTGELRSKVQSGMASLAAELDTMVTRAAAGNSALKRRLNSESNRHRSMNFMNETETTGLFSQLMPTAFQPHRNLNCRGDRPEVLTVSIIPKKLKDDENEAYCRCRLCAGPGRRGGT
jgi:ElaB/YqjD/DUF883 family membrane-anchored ribosome-binding protein